MWLAKRVSLNLNFSFLNRISLLLILSSYPIVLTRLGGPVPDPIHPETFLGYSRESNPEPLGWQSDVLTTRPIPNKRSCGSDIEKKFIKKVVEFFDEFNTSSIPYVARKYNYAVLAS